MKKMSSEQIRETWLNFFHERGHMIEPGASLVPNNDPTLLWINAGVAALKKYFDGSVMPESKRITNVQKCIRTNDIDNVGKTARHQTFFEMLGNFSIGDYFRKEVIHWAFEILTGEKYFAMPKDKLYFTYNPIDLDTKECWLKEGVEPSHLIALEGNYWQIGEGPCGPNTEVFFDRGDKWDPEHIGIELLAEDMENDRYIEIWGIVFSQFNAVNGVDRKDYKELPHKNIDTGAGLERIACVLQETNTNFETDLFSGIIKATQKICKKPYEGEYLMPYRVIADHIRSCTFALADGATFSNEGRGYVLRRLLRRAMRYAQKLGIFESFLYKLVPSVIDEMKCFYPYLVDKKDFIEKQIKSEEEKFIKTLKSGEVILYNELEKGNKILSGEDAFKLYDTYGFPIELTEEIAKDNGFEVDIEGFNKCLEAQKELARKSRKVIESFNKQSKDLLDFNLTSIYTYEDKTIKAKVIGLFKDGVKVESIDDYGEVVFDKTNFYAEMGGEISDKGFIESKEFRADVSHVGKAPNGEHLHEIKVIYGSIKNNDEVTLNIDKNIHESTMKNHSATHLLQAALISVLGTSIKQKGSYVDENYLRFDFSYFEKVKPEDLIKVERMVNEYIAQSIERKTLILPLDEAKKTGAIAEFDGKYQGTVRVVCFGNVSKEFCGGCHVNNTRDIGVFKIEFEGAIASGVRRIQARTGLGAYSLFRDDINYLNNARDILGASSYPEIDTRIHSLEEEAKDYKTKYETLNKKLAQLSSLSVINEIKEENGKAVLVKYFDNMNKAGLMDILDSIKSKMNNYIVVLVGNDEEKHPIIIAVGKDLVSQGIKAGDLMRKVVPILGGNGGGKPDMAQGSVQDVSKIDKIIKVIL